MAHGAPHRAVVTVEDRLAALAEAVESAAGVLPPATLDPARLVLERAGDRLGLGLEHTVVALAGATGSGKSSLFNALAGTDVSSTGVRRPTTGVTHACTWGEEPGGLLAWLGVPRRHQAGHHPDLDGLVLLDLPDHDSTVKANRQEMERVTAAADMIVWVVDPQKYADAAVHDRYLKPLARHGDVLLVVLNQADRLAPRELDACAADLRRLLAEDGLAQLRPICTSATSGAGIDELRRELSNRVRSKRAALERLGADTTAIASRLRQECGRSHAPALDPDQVRRLTIAVAEAAGVGVVTGAVAGSHRGRGIAATGWPVTRWARRLRPDPLRRLHLGRGTGTGARTSLPAAGAVERSRVALAVADARRTLSRGLPEAWADAATVVADERAAAMADAVDRVIAGTDLGTSTTPRWWRVVRVVQTLLLAIALGGALWLTALAVLGYLRLGDLGTPEVGRVPVPTLMLLGGSVAGLLLATVSRPIVGAGARRRARRARRRLDEGVERELRQTLVEPLESIVGRHRRWCEALARASGEKR